MPGGDFVQYGGQAILEGVMMRSPHYWAVACRAPNGKIVVRTEPIEKTWIGRQKWLKLPFLRGTFALLDGMALGHKAMKIAGEIQVDPKFESPKEEDKEEEAPKERAAWVNLALLAVMVIGIFFAFYFGRQQNWSYMGISIGVFAASFLFHPMAHALLGDFAEEYAVPIAMITGIGVGLFIFDYLPNFVAEGSARLLHFDKMTMVVNYLVEVIKFGLFVGYMALIGQLPAIKDLFKYHGAEHKAINALEKRLPIGVEEARAQTRLHPRCGTSFALIVLCVGFLLMPLVRTYMLPADQKGFLAVVGLRFVISLVFLPVIAGISYELLKIAGKFRNEKWVSIAFAPGLWSQRVITTVEPETEHLEVAVASLQAVFMAEKNGDVTTSDDFDEKAHEYLQPSADEQMATNPVAM